MKYPHEELEWVFFDNDEIYEREEDAPVDDETHDDGYHVHAQLPGNHLQVSDGDDLSTDEASDTQRGVPAGRQSTLWEFFPTEGTMQIKRWDGHLPHDRTNQLHDDFIQHIEKLQHQFGLFSHFAHNDSKSHKESNQAWNADCIVGNLLEKV